MVRISRTICFLLFLVSLKGSCEAFPFKFFKTQFDNVLSLYTNIKTIQDAFGQSTSSQIQNLQQEINYRFDSLNQKLMEVKDQILSTITTKLKDKITDKVETLFNHIEYVENKYRIFYDHYIDRVTKSKEQLYVFAVEVTKDLQSVVDLMHNSLAKPDYTKHESIISIIAEANTAADTICVKGLSSQQLIYDLYDIVANADAKALIVTLFANDVLIEAEHDDVYKRSKEQAKEKHYGRLHATYNKVKSFMVTAPREVWRCDPQSLQKGYNFEKLQEVFQGFFINKADLTVINKLHQFLGSITTAINIDKYKCKDIEDERLRCDSEVCKAMPSNKVCLGHMRDCQFVGDEIQVCHANPADDRIYLWGRKIGTAENFGDYSPNCANTQGLIGHGPEQICYCNCESEKQLDLRYFSLLESTSDIQQNKVVTGVRFVTDNHVFHIQIQQGELSKDGTIVGDTEWKSVHRITDGDLLSLKVSKHTIKTLSDPGEKYRFDEWTEWYKNDLVYSVYYKQKKVYLDDFESRGEALVTGLRFKQVDDALRLEVRLTPFDYTTGRLSVNAPNQWKYNGNKTNKRSQVRLDAPGNPLNSRRSTQFSKPNSYIQFKRTDLRKDVGQNTVPFIDLQPVVTVSKEPFPLSGVGLFHRHDENTGGFLAFKIIHYNFAPALPV